MTTFTGSAFAAPHHHRRHHTQHYRGVVGRPTYVPRIYAAPYSNYSGYGGYQTNQGGYGVPHQSFHHDYYHHDYYHDSYHGYHHGR